MSVTLALLLSAVTVAPLSPVAVDVPDVARAGLDRRWRSALASAPACAQLGLGLAARQLEEDVAGCRAQPACLGAALRRAGASHALSPRVEGRTVGYVVTLSLVDAAAGSVNGLAPRSADSPGALEWAFAELAEEACTLLFSAELELDAPAAAQDDLALELPTPEPPPIALPPLDETIPIVPEPPPVVAAAPAPEPVPEPPVVVDEAPAALAASMPPAPLVPPVTPTNPAASALLPLGTWISLGVAVAGTAGGVTFGTRALGAAGERDASSSPLAFSEAQLRAEQQGLFANVAWGVATTAALTGLLLWLGDDAPPPEVRP